MDFEGLSKFANEEDANNWIWAIHEQVSFLIADELFSINFLVYLPHMLDKGNKSINDFFIIVNLEDKLENY